MSNTKSLSYGAGGLAAKQLVESISGTGPIDVSNIFRGNHSETLEDYQARQFRYQARLRRKMAKELRRKGLDGITVSFNHLNLDPSPGKTFVQDLMTARGNVSNIEMRPSKDKSGVDLNSATACSQADFLDTDQDVIECVHAADGDVCLRCDDGALISKTTYNAANDNYNVECHDGTSWVPQGDATVGETYECTVNNVLYKSAIFSETGGGGTCQVNQY